MQKEFFTPKKIKYLSIGFLTLCIGVVVYVVIINISHIGKIPVEIKYAPFEAAVFIDNRNYPVNNAVNWIEPGPHHIMVVMKGFKTLEQDIVITEDTKYLYGSLESTDENSNRPYQEYQTDYIEVEGIAGIESTQEAEKLIEEWPILNYLPYIRDNYSIGSLFDENNDLVVTIRAKAAQLDNAINELRSFQNINLSSYNIKIIDFTNELNNQFINNDNSDPRLFIKTGYNDLTTPFQINNGEQIDNYYFTTISVGKYAGYIPITYRIILEQKNGAWQLVNTPYPILTIYNTPNIEERILEAANRLDGPLTVKADSTGDGH